MRVAVGSDHAGFRLKASILRWLAEHRVPHLDVGALALEPEDDYPDHVAAVARRILEGESDLGIMICGTGQGSCMAANRIPGIRGAACSDTFSARLSRLDNDANVLCLGARVVGEGLALEIVETWLNTAFSGDERHRRRIAKMDALGREEG